MADARAEQILAAIATALTGLASTGSNVQRGQIYAHEAARLPALAITMGADVPATELQSGLLDWELSVFVETVDQVDADEYAGYDVGLEAKVNQMRKEVHAALFADHTLGLAFVHDIIPGPAQQPTLDGDGKLPIGSQLLNFVVRYRSSRGDISA